MEVILGASWGEPQKSGDGVPRIRAKAPGTVCAASVWWGEQKRTRYRDGMLTGSAGAPLLTAGTQSPVTYDGSKVDTQVRQTGVDIA
jgi:hypothetical protein